MLLLDLATNLDFTSDVRLKVTTQQENDACLGSGRVKEEKNDAQENYK